MPIPFIMPKMDMDQESVTIIEWLKKEGEKIQKGEPVIMVETDKITSEIEAPESGTLAGILYHENEEAPVTKVVAYILAEGETDADLPGAVTKKVLASQAVAPKVEPSTPVKTTVPVTPLAEKVAANLQVNLDNVPASGAKVTRLDVENYAQQQKETVISRVKTGATPAARRAAEESGVSLAGIPGSGPRGRIQAGDVLNAAAKPAIAAREPVIAPTATNLAPIPMVGKRKRIAERLTASYQTSPHIYLTVEVDMSAAEASRKRMNVLAEKQGKANVSVTAYLVKMVAWALKRHPYLNSSLHADQIEFWSDINIGIATALDDGLIVPVIHNTDLLTISEINESLRYLTKQARAGLLTREEVDGGTFTISNLGMFGIQSFTAIINPPQSAILAVGSMVRKPVVVDDHNTLEVRPILTLTLSVDHRIVDGAVGAAFLADLVRVLERPDLTLY